jgi:competence protein ComEA
MGEGSRGTLAIWLLAAVVGGIALLRLTGSDGGGRDAAVRIEGGADGFAARGAAGATGGSDPAGRGAPGIYVHVAGAVRRPGLVRLPTGSRVAVALERAGGPRLRADLTGVNLAAELEDGQQVLVPVRGAASATGAVAPGAGGAAGPAGTAPGAPPGSAGTPKLSLAAATLEQLDELDGIGPTLAQRILEYRTEHGGFRSVDELREVEGIGEKRFATLREAVQP